MSWPLGAARDDARVCAGICLLILIAPFEALRPLLRLPGQSLSSVETGVAAVFVASVASVAFTRARVRWQTPLTWPWAAWIATSLIAALFATSDRANAVHMVGRLVLALVVFLLTVNAVTSARRLQAALAAATIASVIVSLLVIAEYAAIPFVLAFLRLFRSGIAVVGAQVRAGGPFQYPTIASMYLEIGFGLALGLLLTAIERGRAAIAVAIAASLLLIAQAIMLTFTRAGLITMAAGLLLVGGVRLRHRGADRGVRVLAVVAAVIVVQLFASRSIEALQLRLSTEGQSHWYRAEIDAPDHLSLGTARASYVTITLTNTGRVTWDPDAARPFRVSYHWLLPDRDSVVVWEGARTELPSAVPPGGQVAVHALVRGPERPGDYRLAWDVEQVDQLWFSTEPDAVLTTSRATVNGAPPADARPLKLTPMPMRAVRPGRLVLWRAAARMLAAHPLTGVGPDNFRLEYGDYARIAHADTRMHSNNMYIEVLAGSGLIGGAVFAWLCVRAARVLVRDLTQASASGVAAAGLAIALHGVVDSFLAFTATYILIAITLGLAVSIDTPGTYDAHRI